MRVPPKLLDAALVLSIIALSALGSGPLWFPLVNGGFLLGCSLLGRWARQNPDDPLTIVLFRLSVGPRTDVEYMTRVELFRSAGSFFTWALFSAVVLGVGGRFFSGQDEPGSVALAIVFACSVGFGMGALGGLYLSARGLLRRQNYRPPPHSEDADQDLA